MTGLAMVDCLGWAATAVFTGSYFCTRPEALRRVQMLGTLMWVAYGVLMHAAPVVAANLLVLAAAAWTARRSPGTVGAGGTRPPGMDPRPPDGAHAERSRPAAKAEPGEVAARGHSARALQTEG